MIILTSLDELNIDCKTSVALGNFDGLHVGHRVITEDAIITAKERGFASLCFTFSNHPFNFIIRRDEKDAGAVKLICSEDEKIRLIDDMGFDILVNLPFDEQMMTMSAEDFFNDFIADKLNAGSVSVGFNYSYGARAIGNTATLKAECERTGVNCNIHDAVKVDGTVVSSTLIREMISIGNMELVRAYLGRAYSFRGRVAHGKKLGSAMGIPTVNIPAPERLMLPPSGVYFSRIVIDGIEYKSVSNIGVMPTITAAENTGSEADIKTLLNDTAATGAKTIETNIFDFNGDLYGKEITVYFDHFSRGEVKFPSKEALFEQIKIDCENAMKFHSK